MCKINVKMKRRVMIPWSVHQVGPQWLTLVMALSTLVLSAADEQRRSATDKKKKHTLVSSIDLVYF